MKTSKTTTTKRATNVATPTTKPQAVAPVQPAEIVAPELPPVIEKTVQIALTQTNKKGKITSSYMFGAKGESLTDFLTDTCKKIVGIMTIQARIKNNGGKSNMFGLTKGGEFELGITVTQGDEKNRLLNNFVFSLPQLGTENPDAVLVDMVDGYKLLTE